MTSTLLHRPILRRAAAVFLALHGGAHVLGFLGTWRLGEFRDVPYTTLILNGTVDVGDLGIRVVGLFWLAAAAAFVGAAIGVWQARDSATVTLAVVTALSLVVCVIGLPAAVIGVGIDLAIVALIVLVAIVRPAALRPVLR